jgi:hypothetical protein
MDEARGYKREIATLRLQADAANLRAERAIEKMFGLQNQIDALQRKYNFSDNK